MSNAMYIAVFERQKNKCSPVATTSPPSTLREAPSLSWAVTFANMINPQTLGSQREFDSDYVFMKLDIQILPH